MRDSDANQLLYLPIVLQAVGRRAEADKALNEQISYWADTSAFLWPKTTHIAASVIAHWNGLNERKSKEIPP